MLDPGAPRNAPSTDPGAGAPAPGPEHARHRARRRSTARRRAVLSCLALVVAAAAVVTAVVVRQSSGGALAGSGGTASTAPASPSSPAPSEVPSSSAGAVQAAALWLAGQPARSGIVAVDPALYDDVASSAQLVSRLVPAPTGAPDEQLSASWLVAGPVLRAGATPGTWAAQALADSRTAAVFGDGDGRVEVREVEGSGASSAPVVPLADGGAGQTTSPPVTSAPPRATATAADAAALEELTRNARLDFSPRAREALRTQQVDLRVAALLVQLAAQQPLSVTDLPSTGGSEPVRTVVLDGVAGRAVGDDPGALALLERQLSAQDPAYRATVQQETDGQTAVLRLVLPSMGT